MRPTQCGKTDNPLLRPKHKRVWIMAKSDIRGEHVRCSGGIEAHADLESAEKCLELGQPVVCSIDYAKGKLRGAPLASTKGHLVTLIGIKTSRF